MSEAMKPEPCWFASSRSSSGDVAVCRLTICARVDAAACLRGAVVLPTKVDEGRCARLSVRPIWRTGMSVVEIMVSLSAISLLAALLIPAVQVARESARRGECLNNVRQLAQACAAHESARGEFPYTAVQFVDQNGRVHPPRSPHEGLLPYLEQNAAFAQIDFNDFPIDISTMPPKSVKNKALVHLDIRVFRCPSDLRFTGGNNYRACMGFGPGIFSPADVAGCSDPGNAAGAFVNGRALKPADFLDGLSATAMFSERVTGSQGAFRPYSDYLVSLPDICSAADAIAICSTLPAGGPYDPYGGSTWLFGGWRHTWYNHVLAPNSPIPDCNAGPIISGGGRGAYTARSYHPWGVNSAMADGSARFISEEIDVLVWRALSSRRGAEARSL